MPSNGGDEMQVGIEPVATLEGALPSRAASMVFEWTALHRANSWKTGAACNKRKQPEGSHHSNSAMSPRIAKARHLIGHRLELTFTDGAVHQLDFAHRILGRGGVFRPLEDPAYFKQLQVDPEAGTIVWPNGVDFCPDVLYALATGKPVKSLEPV